MAVDVAWQGSLFAAGAPSPDAGFGSLARTELAQGAWVDHAPGWLAGSDVLFAHAPWAQRQRKMYEQVLDEPRLTAWWSTKDGDDGLPGAVVGCRSLLSARYGVEFDSVGCNLYRDGRDSVAWHGDNVRKKQAEPMVAILSLGEPRRFLLRPRGGGPSRRYELGNGDLLVMGGTCQHTWEHCVPKVRAAGPRMSVTFRHSRPAAGPATAAG
jgi:alkylated DNA repair dioxygenase AlkB